MQIGYIKLYRQFLDWEWYDDINVCRLFTHLLLKANYEPKKWHGIDIGIGQFLTSRESLAKQTGLTEQQIRTALTKLKSTNEITSQSTNNYSLISITNWDKWQQSNQPTTEPSTNYQPTINQLSTTTKEDKKERSKKSIIGGSSEPPPKQKPEKENFRGTRLSPDWELSEYDGNWAEKEFNLTVEEVCFQADKFKDFWLSKAGAGGVKKDWRGTWRNWIRSYIERKAK